MPGKVDFRQNWALLVILPLWIWRFPCTNLTIGVLPRWVTPPGGPKAGYRALRQGIGAHKGI